jgi:DNA-binding NtrC family response regulator
MHGMFRRDLFHRLMVLAFRLPALRERGDDVDFFADHFLATFARRYVRPLRGFEPAAVDRLRACSWPGNVRQLANAIEAAVLACDGPRIGVRHLPAAVLAPAAPATSRQWAPEDRTQTGRYSHYGSAAEEKRRIEDALVRCRGNKTRAARELGMARNTLRGKLRRLQDAGRDDQSES